MTTIDQIIEEYGQDREFQTLTMLNGLTPSQACRVIQKREAASEARTAAVLTEIAQRNAEIAAQAETPISEKSAKAFEAWMRRKFDKARRETVRRFVGNATFQKIANPTTRQAAIASLTEAQYRQITGK